MDAAELDRYFERIGYAGPRTPTLEVLTALHALHPAAIPFESLDALGGRVPDLSAAALHAKLVESRRGGWCFEHNTLFQSALDALGFRTTALAARVQWQAPPDRVGPRSHMLLKVDLPEGPHVADVGFGGFTPTAPLRLAPDLEQATPHGLFRFVRVGEEFQLQVRLDGRWTNVYQFSLQPQEPVDFEATNWFVATFPGSIFRTTLMAARVSPEARYGLVNRELTIRPAEGPIERRTFDSPEALAKALDQVFGIAAGPADLAPLFVPEPEAAAG